MLLNMTTTYGLFLRCLSAADGMSFQIIIAYHFLFASAFILPIAFFLERGRRPKLTWSVIFYAFLCALWSPASGIPELAHPRTRATCAPVGTNWSLLIPKGIPKTLGLYAVPSDYSRHVYVNVNVRLVISSDYAVMSGSDPLGAKRELGSSIGLAGELGSRTLAQARTAYGRRRAAHEHGSRGVRLGYSAGAPACSSTRTGSGSGREGEARDALAVGMGKESQSVRTAADLFKRANDILGAHPVQPTFTSSMM
ncbi:WAT1-related protein [Cucumis melo var. makuwa]|uniref:WAT1-related protein n=1 Tax=Cucumis melo var. makuwa TaxID=1194695 RepID=A0A5A7VK92_CUCMM|nr:WAT1-related protein [Cucumis melo var. makuwa]